MSLDTLEILLRPVLLDVNLKTPSELGLTLRSLVKDLHLTPPPQIKHLNHTLLLDLNRKTVTELDLTVLS